MEEYFVTYNQALALKELGFDEPCFGFYYRKEIDLFESCKIQDRRNSSYVKNYMDEEDCTAPLKSQVFKWFRDEHKTQSLIQEYDINNYMFTIDDGINEDISVVGFIYYEEAESACIDNLIEIVKSKKQ
jgi:hypothetical protein